MVARRDKRFRVTGFDQNDDIHAFVSDSRERAKAMEAQMRKDLPDVTFDMQRSI